LKKTRPLCVRTLKIDLHTDFLFPILNNIKYYEGTFSSNYADLIFMKKSGKLMSINSDYSRRYLYRHHGNASNQRCPKSM